MSAVGRYRAASGHRAALEPDGSVANDPEQTYSFAVLLVADVLHPVNDLCRSALPE